MDLWERLLENSDRGYLAAAVITPGLGVSPVVWDADSPVHRHCHPQHTVGPEGAVKTEDAEEDRVHLTWSHDQWSVEYHHHAASPWS